MASTAKRLVAISARLSAWEAIIICESKSVFVVVYRGRISICYSIEYKEQITNLGKLSCACESWWKHRPFHVHTVLDEHLLFLFFIFNDFFFSFWLRIDNSHKTPVIMAFPRAVGGNTSSALQRAADFPLVQVGIISRILLFLYLPTSMSIIPSSLCGPCSNCHTGQDTRDAPSCIAS